MWSSAFYAQGVYQSLISQYQAFVFEFTEELLAAKHYYQRDPNFWVGSGLVADANAQTTLSLRPLVSPPLTLKGWSQGCQATF